MILDGWGMGKKDASDGPFLANTPFLDSLFENKPHCFLKTFGENVGLPEGQMGNSEVGHLNIGAGRIVWQMLVKINRSFENNEVESYSTFQKMIQYLNKNPNANIHLTGLISNGGVHSSMNHAISLCGLLKNEGMDKRTFLHIISDGRDTDPKSGINFVKQLTKSPELQGINISSICGRYFAMDRDKRWERTSLFYNLLAHGEGDKFSNYEEVFIKNYENKTTDEFIQPAILPNHQNLKEGDVFFMFNYRTDRGRQIIEALTQQDFPEHQMKTIHLFAVTMTEYDKKFKGLNILFENEDLNNTLGEVVSNQGLKQLRAAETEKYPHVTFFFNGGRELNFDGEDRLMVNSPQVATYDLKPEMSAPELTNALLEKINKNIYDLMVVNFANPDMVGHTGVQNAIINACEVVDNFTRQLFEAGRALDYQFIITADHGNSDLMFNLDGSPHTAHTTNLVPCFVISPKVISLTDGTLANLAPTVLKLMDIEKPDEMTAESLIL
jgi:2,3-bisphosphoglycerate-independent phosphoglycerate mutase